MHTGRYDFLGNSCITAHRSSLIVSHVYVVDTQIEVKLTLYKQIFMQMHQLRNNIQRIQTFNTVKWDKKSDTQFCHIRMGRYPIYICSPRDHGSVVIESAPKTSSNFMNGHNHISPPPNPPNGQYVISEHEKTQKQEDFTNKNLTKFNTAVHVSRSSTRSLGVVCVWQTFSLTENWIAHNNYIYHKHNITHRQVIC